MAEGSLRPGVRPDTGRLPCPQEVGIRLHVSSGVILGGILILAAGLRFAWLGQQSLWADEAFVVWVTRHGWASLLPLLGAGDTHPPLYYVLMKAWVGIAGTGEVALRAPSACLSVLSVALTYALMRRVSSEQVSLLSAFLVSISPFHIMAGQEARMYPLLGTLVLASTLALVESVERGGGLRWAGYVVLATLMVYTQYLGFLVLVAHGLWVACCARRHFLQYLAGMAVLAFAFAPWGPSLWDQSLHVRALQPVVRGSGPLGLGDILGLFAFGGSLFGMGSYFFGGTLGPVAQGGILLPFLIVGWRGVHALAADRRTLVLLGLAPALTLGIMFALPGVRPHARLFSFLLPFCAMLLARGLVDASEQSRVRPDRVLVVLAFGLILYSVPVLAGYYLDPLAHPFQWRAAAALVERQARPGDFFLYVGDPAEQAFTYYFRDAHPSLTLTPREWMPRHDPPTFTDAKARELAEHAPRVWLIMTTPLGPQNPLIQQRLMPALRRAFYVVGQRDFVGTWVYLLEANPRDAR